MKNGGRCWLSDWDSLECFGPIDAAHCFPKGACPAARYEVDLGEPVCRRHHQLYGNGRLWKAMLWQRWGLALFAERYALAHTAGRKLDLAAVKASLEAAG